MGRAAVGPCSIEGCGQQRLARGWCSTHYWRWSRKGDPLWAPPVRPKHCSVEGCERPPRALGWCNMHWRRLKEMPKCTVEGCDTRQQARGLCPKHRSRLLKYGSPDRLKGTPWGAPGQFLREVVLTHEGEECLAWPFRRSTRGRAVISTGDKKRVDVMVAWLVCMLTYGPPQSATDKPRFSCDGASHGCCSPSHLSWQTREP
jgi:hypothetical protein